MGVLGHQHEIKPAPEVGGNAQSWGETKPVALETGTVLSPLENLWKLLEMFLIVMTGEEVHMLLASIW